MRCVWCQTIFVLLVLVLFVGFFILIGEKNGVDQCKHCGYTYHFIKDNDGCRVPGCDQKTPHR